MSSLSGLTVKSSEQHVDMRNSRRRRDLEDCTLFIEWFKNHNPFTIEDSDLHLHSLSSGLISIKGEDNVNCDMVVEVGAKIQKSINNKTITAATIKRHDLIRPLDALFNVVKINKKPLYMDPTILFTRLIAIAQREEGLVDYFNYDLTTTCMSLFKDNLMRKPDKPSLRKVILKDQESIASNLPDVQTIVIDGGGLLHRVRWNKGMKILRHLM